MISESRARGNFREAKRIFRIVLTLFLIIGTAGMSVMLLFNRQFAAAYQLNRANYCIMAIAPTLFFTCVSSSIRGYFQGYQNMLPTAVSQMIEAVCKLTLGVLMGRYAVSMGMENHVAAAYAITGVTIGVAAGMLFLCISKLTFRATVYDAEYVLPAGEPIPEPRATKTLLRQLIVLSVPIMISSSVMSFTSMLDSMIVSDRLHSLGYVESEIAAKLGNYKTLAVSLFNLPPALIYPISYSIVPLLAAANAKDGPERVRTIVQSSYKVAALIALPCSLGLSVLSKPILCLLFDEASADRAAPLLSLLSLSIFFIGMLAISNAVLQAHKKERLPIVSMLVGSVVKLAVSFVLVGNRNDVRRAHRHLYVLLCDRDGGSVLCGKARPLYPVREACSGIAADLRRAVRSGGGRILLSAVSGAFRKDCVHPCHSGCGCGVYVCRLFARRRGRTGHYAPAEG